MVSESSSSVLPRDGSSLGLKVLSGEQKAATVMCGHGRVKAVQKDSS